MREGWIGTAEVDECGKWVGRRRERELPTKHTNYTKKGGEWEIGAGPTEHTEYTEKFEEEKTGKI
jgi:hypothetical protein